MVNEEAREELQNMFLAEVRAVTPEAPEIRASQMWRDTGIPRRLWGYSLHDYTRDYPEMVTLSKWATGYKTRHALDDNGYPANRRGYGTGLFLYGPPAKGKTTAACAILTSFAKLYAASVYASVYFVRWDNFLRAKQGLIAGGGTESYQSVVDAVDHVALLALDDVGHEYSASAYGPALLDQVIRSRYDRGLPTIITTNLSEAAWTEKYDATLTSFIKRACRPLAFPVTAANAGQ